MLASSTCCSLWTGTTISTSGPARARMAAGCCSSGVCMPPMVAPDPWGQLGRAWEVAGSSGGAGGVRGTAGVVPRWVGGQGEDHPEAGAPAGDAVDLDGAAVDGGKGGHDRQAEPGAAAGGGAGRVGPVEALEDPLGLLGGEAGAVVDDLDGGPGAAVEGGGPDPDLDRAAGRGVGEGVVDQVGQHLAQPLVVAEHDQGAALAAVAVVAGAEDELDLAVGGDRPGVVDGLGGQGEQVHRVVAQRALLVEAGQQQEVLDQQPH